MVDEKNTKYAFASSSNVKWRQTQKLRGDAVMTEVTAAQFFVQNPAGMEVENQLAS
mgnify:CR=1 FL=1